MKRRHHCDAEVVCLNIGGVRFETTLTTLLPCDFFRAAFAGGFCSNAGRKEAIFVDRSGALFEDLLLFLRNGGLRPSESTLLLRGEALLEEARYFGLQDMVLRLTGQTCKLDLRPADRQLSIEEERLRALACPDDTSLADPWQEDLAPRRSQDLMLEPSLLFRTAAPSRLEGTHEDFRRRLAQFVGEGLLQGLRQIPGAVLAGGAVCAALTGGEAGDVDVFLLCAPAAAEAQLRAIHDVVRRAATHEAGVDRLLVTRSAAAVTYYRGDGQGGLVGRPVQVVLRTFASKAQLLGEFDVDAACACYDLARDTVHLGRRGVRALRYGTVVADTCFDSPSYARRLEKYGRRGFQVAIPGLDVARLAPDLRAGSFALAPHLGMLLRLSHPQLCCCDGPVRLEVSGRRTTLTAEFTQEAAPVRGLKRLVLVGGGGARVGTAAPPAVGPGGASIAGAVPLLVGGAGGDAQVLLLWGAGAEARQREEDDDEGPSKAPLAQACRMLLAHARKAAAAGRREDDPEQTEKAIGRLREPLSAGGADEGAEAEGAFVYDLVPSTAPYEALEHVRAGLEFEPHQPREPLRRNWWAELYA